MSGGMGSEREEGWEERGEERRGEGIGLGATTVRRVGEQLVAVSYCSEAWQPFLFYRTLYQMRPRVPPDERLSSVFHMEGT